jgi:hypothetical protein
MRVWDAVTKPEWVKQWQYGSDLITDWHIGSEIRFRTKWEGNVYEQWGTVLEFAPYHSLRYSLFAPRPGLEDTPENSICSAARPIRWHTFSFGMASASVQPYLPSFAPHSLSSAHVSIYPGLQQSRDSRCVHPEL